MSIQIDAAEYPTLASKERPFFDYWMANVVDPADPHLPRWIEYEDGAVARAESRTALIEQYEPVEGKDILEIGCQNGAWLIALALAGANAVGIDVVEPAVKAASIRAGCWDASIDARVGDACKLDFDDNSFDIIASSDVIEHVPDKSAMVSEVMRVLRPGGLAVISAPVRFSVKHFRSDPHYQHAGVSIWPAPLIAWYLKRFRNEPVYEVETLPTAVGIRRSFRRAGATVISPIDDSADTSGALDWAKLATSSTLDEFRQGFTLVVRKR